MNRVNEINLFLYIQEAYMVRDKSVRVILILTIKMDSQDYVYVYIKD